MVTLSVDFTYFTGKMERIGHVEKSSNEAILKFGCTVDWIVSCGANDVLQVPHWNSGNLYHEYPGAQIPAF